MKVVVTGGSGFIGTHLVNDLVDKGHQLLNIDLKPPKIDRQKDYWFQGDVLDYPSLVKSIQYFSPDWIVHLAARTDMYGKTLEDYRANFTGTENLLKATAGSHTVSRLIITSTQFVHRPGPKPETDEDYDPHTLYGQSKVIAEKLTRQAQLDCTWTIIRPTNIWGPWHPRYPQEFWRVLKTGMYIHPLSSKPVVRCYGYVKNVIWQIDQILNSPKENVNRKTFYMSDPPAELLTWVDAFSIALTGKKARRVPALFVWILGFIGSAIGRIGVTFPINLSRYRSMTESYIAPVEPMLELFGVPPYSLAQGVDETIMWLKTHSL